MRRLLATMFTASVLVALAGCGKSYENRVNLTLERMRYLQRLDQYLQAPAADPLQPLGIYLRVPRPLTRAAAPGLVIVAPPEFDAVATFLDVSAPPAKGAAPPPTVRLHVFARSKQAQAAAAKKGEEAPPPYERQEFQAAVFEVLLNNMGGFDPNEVPRQSDKKRLNDFQRVVFTAANGNIIRTYFFKQDDHEVALVWEIPPSLEKSTIATTAAELTLESMAVGRRAAAAFQGLDEEDGLIPGGTGPGVETGVAF